MGQKTKLGEDSQPLFKALENMKVSLVITVLNEEKTIERLLNSLAKQTKKPNEIIVVDGGSTDSTVAKIRKYYIPHTAYHMFKKPGFSIAAGRNFGVKKARYPIIAMTDTGCVAHSDWLEKITRPFTRPGLLSSKGLALSIPEVAAGFYRMTGKSVFQKCLACYLGVLPEKLDPKTFLPSTRSIAFRKEIWKKIGGFNEKLERTGEDTLFNHQAKKLGAKFVTVADALVDWEMPKTWREAVKKFYTYAKGDAQTGIWWDSEKKLATHNIKILLIFGRYLVGLLLFFSLFTVHCSLFTVLLVIYCLLLVYLYWAIAKNYRFVRHWQAIFNTKYQALLILPALQIVSDLAVMGGFIAGRVKKRGFCSGSAC